MPLLFDMPLEKLKVYKGTNPKPKDFDQFWDKSIAEMKAIKPNIEIIPAGFKSKFADAYHLYFTGINGAKIHAKLLKPKKLAKQNPAVLKFHGYSMSSGDWFEILPYAAEGYIVASLDCRGQGGLSEDNGSVVGWTLRGQIIRGVEDKPEKLYYRQVFLDTAQLANIVMNMDDVDENRVGATGGSQGGGLTLACAALEPRLKLAATVFPFLTDYQRVWEIDQINGAYNELQEWFRKRDPQHKRHEEFFNQLGYIDIQHLAARIKAEVFMSTGFMDTTCPPSTQFAAYNKIKSKKQVSFYPDYGHEYIPMIQDEIHQFLLNL